MLWMSVGPKICRCKQCNAVQCFKTRQSCCCCSYGYSGVHRHFACCRWYEEWWEDINNRHSAPRLHGQKARVTGRDHKPHVYVSAHCTEPYTI